MSRHVTPRLDWSSILVEDEESDQPVGAVVDQQPRDEQPQQEEPPTESQDITPDEEKADAGAPEVQGTDLEADLQELAKPMTGAEGGDDPEAIGHACANPEPIEMPETGEGKPAI
ncbi:P antigen family member 3-like [Myotis yumanensis]|uniref:P antigen family member 3-like n=1 Tax=Myotis yumanensis TaxID=159337 RepID=UPI0038D1A2BA